MKRKILLVEDNEDIRTIYAEMLEELNFAVIACGNGAIALQKVQQESFDAIITDWHMPQINGVEFVKHALEVVENIPIYFMSSDDLREAKSLLGSRVQYFSKKSITQLFLHLKEAFTNYDE